MTGETLANGVIDGNRRALSRAITLVESGRSDHRLQAEALLDDLAGLGEETIFVGLSGTPGVGKSTFIEAFGMMLIEAGHKVAVLAVDPSSARSGGSILGDKTRMEQLSRAPGAFIRPSPSQSEMGGVARRTREAARICAAAGYDIVLIETVGVGQSETMVADMSDVFVLLLAPAGGDELQGVKRGIMERADIIVVNKADGDLESAAMRTCADYAGALGLLRKRADDKEGFPKAVTVSALTGTGLEALWGDIEDLVTWRRDEGFLAKRRAEQAQNWFLEEVRYGIENMLKNEIGQQAIEAGRAAVAAGKTSPASAARQVLEALGKTFDS